MRRRPVVIKRELEGFVLNRLQGALLREAFRLVEQGYVDIDGLDTTIRDGLGLRWAFMGPFETIDLNAPGSLATSAAALPFHPNTPFDHGAPIWLRMGDWAAAVAAVKTIESWRRKPVPLSWMLQANLELTGLQANLGMLAELAWISPKRLEEVVSTTTEPMLKQLIRKFETTFAGYEIVSDLVWFPAWVLTERPNFSASFALAQPSNHSPAEKAMRIMIALLGLERRGRHHDTVTERKHLKAVNEELFLAYMKSR